MKRKLMKQLPLLALALVATIIVGSLTSASSPPLAPSASGELYAPDRILVRFKPGVSAATIAALHRAQGAVAIREIPQIRVQVLRVPSNRIPEVFAAYSRNPNVLYAEPDYIAHALGDPNDEYFPKQWGLDNDGQAYKDSQSGMVDADVDAPEAWDITIGSSAFIIAILDTGIDQNHPDLDGKLAGNKNFTDSSTVDDLYGHGTHVAGIAAAETNNTEGVAGVGYNSSLLNVKVLNDQAVGYYSWIANGIVWAADNGAKVINMSLGGTRKSSTLEDAVNYAWSKGVVLAAAAGNSGNPSPTYPAKYENCIAVAATDSNDQKAGFSSYGSWVDVAAPGLDIFSTFPNHDYAIGKSLDYDFGSGTSMSTPFVSGLAALVWATEYGNSNSAVRDRIEATCDAIPGTGEYWIHGRINACKAVGGTACDEMPAVTDIAITAISAPSSVVQGDTVSVDVTVENVGNQDVTTNINVIFTDDTDSVTIGTQTISSLAAGASTTLTFSWDTSSVSLGDHTLTASHDFTDDDDTNDSKSVTVTISETADTMHVPAIDMWYVKRGPNYFVYTSVTIVDESNNPVSEATVYLTTTLPDGSTVSDSGITGSDGTVTFSVKSRQNGTYASEVTSVTHASLTYDPVANFETSESLSVP